MNLAFALICYNYRVLYSVLWGAEGVFHGGFGLCDFAGQSIDAAKDFSLALFQLTPLVDVSLEGSFTPTGNAPMAAIALRVVSGLMLICLLSNIPEGDATVRSRPDPGRMAMKSLHLLRHANRAGKIPA